MHPRTEMQSLLLARVHEVAQILADQVVSFMTGPRFSELSQERREHLGSVLVDVTSVLGRHTFATLSVDDYSLDAHLPRLFLALEALNATCAEVGARAMPSAVALYKARLQEVGLQTTGH